MLLSERLAENVRACFTGIWIQSHEHDEALLEMSRLCHSEDWRLLSWDIDRGLQGTELAGDRDTSLLDPLAAIHCLGSQADPDRPTLLVLKNFHRFINSPEIIQALTQQINLGKQARTFIVILSSLVQIPTELEKLFVCLEHDLPDRDQLLEIARSIATEADELPEGQELECVLDAASGLTRYEAEGAFSLSLVRHARIEASVVLELKSQTLLKSGLLSLHQGTESFAGLGGLESLKAFCLQALRSRSQDTTVVRPRGVLLLGVPGTGKSAFAKALGKETGRPTLTLDVGALMGSLLGQTEERTRRALRIVDAMQPAVLFIDEVEKGPDDRHWTGSEIRACCRLAALLDVPLIKAAENVVPVAVTAAESVARLRRWASRRCLSAEQPGIFSNDERSGSRSRRNLSRDPHRN